MARKKRKLTEKQRRYFGARRAKVFQTPPHILRAEIEEEVDNDDLLGIGHNHMLIEPRFDDQFGLYEDGLSNEDLGLCPHGTEADEGCEELDCDF